VPVAVVGLPARATGVAAAEAATCAALADGTVWCWGDGAGGLVNPSLGNGTNASSAVPVQALGIGDAVAIAGSWFHFCARRATGAVACWGGNGAGELGDGTTTDRNAPVAVAGLADAIDVSCGRNHTCAVRRTGEVVCWGDNQFGQLGDGTQVLSIVPKAAALIPPSFAVAAGNTATCAALLDGTARCVGWAGAIGGQLGDGSTQTYSTTPVTPTLTVDLPPFPPFDVPLFGVESIATNGYEGTSCAATLFGEAFCWGDNAQGEVGDGSTQPATVLRPTRVDASF
jgi:alpha-tubulin suppressor-like RCC1 family protein